MYGYSVCFLHMDLHILCYHVYAYIEVYVCPLVRIHWSIRIASVLLTLNFSMASCTYVGTLFMTFLWLRTATSPCHRDSNIFDSSTLCLPLLSSSFVNTTFAKIKLLKLNQNYFPSHFYHRPSVFPLFQPPTHGQVSVPTTTTTTTSVDRLNSTLTCRSN